MLRALAIFAWLALAIQPGLAQASGKDGALAPGKPAGLHEARTVSHRALFIGASIVLVALAFVLPASSTSSAATATPTTN